MIDGDWKLIVPAPQNEADAPLERYNLMNDPKEEANAAEHHPEQVEAMCDELDKWWGVTPSKSAAVPWRCEVVAHAASSRSYQVCLRIVDVTTMIASEIPPGRQCWITT